jgi:hypothetical protein
MVTFNLRMLFLIPIILSLVGIGYFSYANIDYNNHNRMVTCNIDSCKSMGITRDPVRYIVSVSYSTLIFNYQYSNSEVLHVPDSSFCDLKTIGCSYNEYYVRDNPELHDILSLNEQISWLYGLMILLSIIVFFVTVIMWCMIKLEDTRT